MTTYIKRFAVNKQPVKDPNGGWINYTDVCIDTNPRFEHLLTSPDIVILNQAAEIARLREALEELAAMTKTISESDYAKGYNVVVERVRDTAARALRGE